MTNLLVKIFIGNFKNTNGDLPTEVRKKFGMLSGIVGIICNVILFAAKLFVGIITSSIAVSADAFNNLADAGGSIVTLACFKIAGAPADKEHPFGHGRVEYISGLVLSVAILITGLGFFKSSIEKIISPEPIVFSKISLIILIFSLFLKLWMGLFNRKLGKMVNSSAMKAASLDSLADVAATGAVILSMIVTHFTGLCLDSYAGIIVAAFILFTGIGILKESLGPLLGQAPAPELVNEIHKIILSHKEVVGIHELMIHNYGPGRSVISLHAEMPAEIDILELHEIIDNIEKELKERFNCQAIIHLDPIITDDKRLSNIREKISNFVKILHPLAKIYDLRVIPSSKNSTLVFGLSIPFDLNKNDNEIIYSLKKGLKAIDKSYEYIININRECLEENLDHEGCKRNDT